MNLAELPTKQSAGTVRKPSDPWHSELKNFCAAHHLHTAISDRFLNYVISLHVLVRWQEDLTVGKWRKSRVNLSMSKTKRPRYHVCRLASVVVRNHVNISYVISMYTRF